MAITNSALFVFLWRTRSFLSLKRAMSSGSTTSDVLFEKIGNKGVITLNRPKALNAITLPMIKEITSYLRTWQSEAAFVILRSNSEKAFCAGGDVVAVVQAVNSREQDWSDFFYHEYRMNHLIGTYKIPHVALIHGITMGGGVGLSIHGRYRVATEKTMFAMPETVIGMIPDVGATHFLPKLKRNLGKFLAFTGHRLIGYDVLRAGIATHFCDSDKFTDLQNDLLALNDATELDKLLERYTEASVLGKRQESSLEPIIANIETLFSDETVESIVRVLERDGSEWALKQRDAIGTKSPTALKLSARLLQEGKKLSLKEALALEFNILQTLIPNGDYKEGVRALLVDKDNKPKWKKSRLEDVSDSYIDSYFSSAPRRIEFD